jgi:Tfp pilus assembly protein PilE
VRRGYTLIEVLILVCIIAIFGCILFGALDRAASPAREEKARRLIEERAAFNASFPIPAGTIVGEAKSEACHIIFKTVEPYTPFEVNSLSYNNLNEMVVHTPYNYPNDNDTPTIKRGLPAIGHGTSRFSLRQLWPVAVAVPDKSGYTIEVQDLEIPEIFTWCGKGQYSGYSWGIPLDIKPYEVDSIKWREVARK